MTTEDRTASPALQLDGVGKTYGKGAGSVRALDGVDLSFASGSFTAVMGPSGSGKSTLLHTAAGLDTLTYGSVSVNGVPMIGRTEAAMTKFRRQNIGIVFQESNLLEHLTVLQNVELPLRLDGKGRGNRGRVRGLIETVGIGHRLGHRPAQLSGGQRQRVAIARALVNQPCIVLADEPTGSLDSRGARDVLDLLREMVDRLGQTVVMVTHDPIAASFADLVVFLADGAVVGRLGAPTPESVAQRMTAITRVSRAPLGAERAS